jgi:hypothetical protein
MNLQDRRTILLSHLTDTLRRLPGATSLYLFGSGATGQSDGYADLDLQIYTADKTAYAVWPRFLERVGPIEAAWPMSEAIDNTAYSIFFEGESCYHKVDIGVSMAVTGAGPAETGVKLWLQSPAPQIAHVPSSTAYIPSSDSVGCQVLEELIASERYVRARKRGQQLLCWRFIRDKPDRWLRLHCVQHSAGKSYEGSLTTCDIKALEEQLPPPIVAQFTNNLSWAEPGAMDAGMLWFTDEILRLWRVQAAILNEDLPEKMIKRHLAFIRDELSPS